MVSVLNGRRFGFHKSKVNSTKVWQCLVNFSKSVFNIYMFFMQLDDDRKLVQFYNLGCNICFYYRDFYCIVGLL